MVEETNLERRENRIKKSLEYGKKTFQLIAKEDEAKVAWAISLAVKELSKKTQHEILKLIVNRDLRKLIELKLKKSERPGENLREALERVEEDTAHLSKKNQENARNKLKKVEEKLEARIREKIVDVKKSHETKKHHISFPKETLKHKLKIEHPQKPKVKNNKSPTLKQKEIKSELERAQIMVKEIIAVKIAEELNVKEQVILHKLNEAHWISAPIAALSKTITVGMPREQIEEEVNNIVEWIEDNLLEGLIEEFQN